MKSVGDKFPKFKKPVILADKEIGEVTSADHKKEGKWMVIFWYPKDFTFICLTEIVEFNNNHSKFVELDAELYGASTDTEEVHLAWRTHDPKLVDLSFPLISDTSKTLSKKLGILQSGSVAYRATFIVDPDGVIQWINCNNDATQRNVAEVLRALEACQNHGLTGRYWQQGDTTL